MRSPLPFLTALSLVACGSSSPNHTADGGAPDAHRHADATTDAHAADAGHPSRDAGHDSGHAPSDSGRDAGTVERDAARDAGDSGRDSGRPRDASPDSAEDAGALCTANTDCVGGTCGYSVTVCSDGGCATGPACPGTCQAYATKGGFCLVGAPPICAPDSGLVCDPFSHACLPASSERLPVVGTNDRCGLGVANCVPKDYCYAPVFPDQGTCLRQGGDGGACPAASLLAASCAGELVCVGTGSGLEAGTCAPPSPAGGPCVPVPPGEGSSGCIDTALCVDGGCVALPTSGACVDGQCAPGSSYCSASGRCEPLRANGAECASATECASALCASTTHTCVAALPLGAECGEAYDCSGGACGVGASACESGICDFAGVCATAMCARGDGGG